MAGPLASQDSQPSATQLASAIAKFSDIRRAGSMSVLMAAAICWLTFSVESSDQ
jgi:hypothetical protein